ncbi:M13 family metallopeptidase [Mycoplasma sp. 6243]|uniref:M13 family metallopeptidase n=1 Tax=Mycoplasma sp. 6243 TaxID=3440865 RepID=UPI003EB728DB
MNKKDDFYEYVNAEWLKTAKIPEDRSSIGSFVELELNLEKLLKNLISLWSLGKQELPKDHPMMSDLVKFYQLIINSKKRNELGWQPVRNFLDRIYQFNSFNDIFNANRDVWLNYNFLPLELQIYEDFTDNDKRILWLDSVSVILPSKETYEQPKEKEKLLNAWKNMVNDLLLDYGFAQQKVNIMIENAIAFDDIYKDYILSSVEQADYVSLYNLKTREELSLFSKKYDFLRLLDLIIGQKVSEASIPNLRLFAKFDEIFNEVNFEKFRDSMFIKNMLATTTYLSEEIRIKATEYANAVNSVAKVRELNDFAYDLTSKFFGMPLGMFYADKYFGSKAKADVENMIASMIDVYKDSLLHNSWLSKETIQKAILKLEKFEPMVGYPEKIRPYYAKFKVKTYQDGSNIFENIKEFNKHISEYQLSLYHKSEDKKLWGMTPATINAYYNPMRNQIVFPAAILASPFYDVNQSKSANFGGIGVVIAHEISHGFDNNGAQFDENGKLNNWWTANDLNEFKKRTQAVIDLYDGTETEYGKVNGKLTVSENIADLGGFDCALKAAQKYPDFDAHAFFENWATVWRAIYKEGRAKRLLDSDVHTPTKVRANKVLSNNELFLKIYDIKEGDQMYLSPEKRIKIW